MFTKVTINGRQQHEHIKALGQLMRDYMFVRYPEGNKLEEKDILSYCQSIDFNVYSDEFNVYYLISYYAYEWVKGGIEFKQFAEAFYAYLLQGKLEEETARGRAQLMVELGHAMGRAPKTLFTPLGFFTSFFKGKEAGHRMKLAEYFKPLLTLIDIAPTWEDVLREKFDKKTKEQARKEFHTSKTPLTAFFNCHSTEKPEYKEWRDAFVGEEGDKLSDEAKIKAEISGANNNKAKALIDFINEKMDFEEMMKVIKIADESLLALQLSDSVISPTPAI